MGVCDTGINNHPRSYQMHHIISYRLAPSITYTLFTCTKREKLYSDNRSTKVVSLLTSLGTAVYENLSQV